MSPCLSGKSIEHFSRQMQQWIRDKSRSELTGTYSNENNPTNSRTEKTQARTNSLTSPVDTVKFSEEREKPIEVSRPRDVPGRCHNKEKRITSQKTSPSRDRAATSSKGVNHKVCRRNGQVLSYAPRSISKINPKGVSCQSKEPARATYPSNRKLSLREARMRRKELEDRILAIVTDTSSTKLFTTDSICNIMNAYSCGRTTVASEVNKTTGDNKMHFFLLQVNEILEKLVQKRKISSTTIPKATSNISVLWRKMSAEEAASNLTREQKERIAQNKRRAISKLAKKKRFPLDAGISPLM